MAPVESLALTLRSVSSYNGWSQLIYIALIFFMMWKTSPCSDGAEDGDLKKELEDWGQSLRAE